MKNINFKERLSIVKDILKDCPYEMYKTEIRELFEKTSNTNTLRYYDSDDQKGIFRFY